MLKGQRPMAVLLIAYAMWGLYAVFFGERITVNDGLGWDGRIYYFISADFIEYARGRVFDSYYVQRVVPSLIVRAIHWTTCTEHSYRLTGTMFGLLNLVSMLGGTLLLVSALRDVVWRWRWMAALFALVSFGGLRHPFYYPMLTDAFSFLLGATMLWAFLREKRGLLLMVTLFGAFTTPILLLMAFPLLAFQRKVFLVNEETTSDRAMFGLMMTAIALLALIGPAFRGTVQFEAFQPSGTMVLLALPFLLAYVGLLWWNMGIAGRLRASFSSIDRSGMLMWGTVLISVAVCAVWAKPAAFRFMDFGIGVISNGLVHPAIFALSHIVYLGPAFLLILLFPFRLKDAVANLPLPLFWTVMSVFMLMVNSESRTLMAGLPFILYVLAAGLRDVSLNITRCAALIGVSLFLSKFWFTVNEGAMDGGFLEFPMQRYFMHIGPWMNTETYLMQLGVVVICGTLLRILFWKTDA